MTKDEKDITAELTEFRAQIDALDDKLISLLIERTELVTKVGELKHKHLPGQCPVRPGREAEQVRRIMQKFTGTNFSPAAAAAIWRIIIGTMVTLEGELKLAVYAPDREHDLFWLARKYFGPSMPVIKHPHVKRVIGDIMDGKATIGVIPMLRSSDTTYWWTNLVQQGKDMPKVFAHIPFVYPDVPGRDAPAGLAIARIKPEASGDDKSLYVIEADSNCSQHRLQTAFAGAKLEANWISIATLNPATRHHLMELKGFVTETDEGMKKFLGSLGNSILNATFIGAYATPVIIMPGVRSHDSKPIAYSAGNHKA